jgi:arylsulfatase A-like enzyme
MAVDTLRADHLSCYGYHRLTSPHLDRLASQGVLFERCYAPNVPTTPAYCSMLTGMDVMTTRMVALQPNEPLPAHLRTLPEVLKERGYVSACIGFSGEQQEARYRGFDQYMNFRSWVSWEERPGDKAGKLNEKAIPWLNDMVRAGQPFFLFLRHMDPHSPYLPPPPFDRVFYSGDETDSAHLQTEWSMQPVFDFAPFAEFFKSWMPPGLTDARYVIAQYDGAIAYMDACIAQLLTRLEELGVAGETIVILTGDHGESLLEHEIYFDHHGLYECTIHVPLIIKAPGALPQGVRVPGYVAHQDLMPTILDLLGQADLMRELNLDGKSVLPLVRGERTTNYTELYLTECTWMRKRGWRTHEWKLIEALEPDFHHKPPLELYNLLADPEERHNLAEQEPHVVQYLRDRMQAWVDRRVRETGRPDPILQYHIGTDRKIGSVKQARDLQAQADVKPDGQAGTARRRGAARAARTGERAEPARTRR